MTLFWLLLNFNLFAFDYHGDYFCPNLEPIVAHEQHIYKETFPVGHEPYIIDMISIQFAPELILSF